MSKEKKVLIFFAISLVALGLLAIWKEWNWIEILIGLVVISLFSYGGYKTLKNKSKRWDYE